MIFIKILYMHEKTSAMERITQNTIEHTIFLNLSYSSSDFLDGLLII